MVSATWDEVRARRLARSSLLGRASGDRLVGVAHDLGGGHAEVQTSAELQLCLRLDGVAPADVRGALWERRLAGKALRPRGTLHPHPSRRVAPLPAASGGGPRPP